ncbi:hypothetical protein B0O95_103152 [Mycetohabitans endofungorum]|uniref:Uncharacterized protein n=1 Tax=Mycetohabitans endofungorum TaxID=417203 RepID=A0A2P5KCN3_9BURK|nr:hypothetical protein B0O95_103152 [Mycetohabitans endofungorum]
MRRSRSAGRSRKSAAEITWGPTAVLALAYYWALFLSG